MDNKEFLDEALEYVRDEYRCFIEIQDVARSLLGYFDELCRNNAIEYSVECGSLIGCVRDHGLIPWDSDIDVFISIKDADRLVKVFQTQLSDEYFFDSNITNKKTLYYMTRLGKKGYPLGLVHLDIFYLIGMDKEKFPYFRKKIERLYNAKDNRARALYRSFGPGLKGFAIKLYLFLLSLRGGLFIDKKLDSISRRFDFDSSDVLAVIGDFPYCYNRDDLFPCHQTEIDNMTVFLPNKPGNVLNVMYKDYTSYLPVGSRFDTFYSFMKAYENARGIREGSYRK